MQTTLVVMAAGMGSRFGGIKQLEPVGPSGEIIIDYSVFDAIKAGFSKVVFIIRKDIEKDFKDVVGDRLKGHIDIEYVYQDVNHIPRGYSVPEERTKPWGTGQAILSCKDIVKEPFLVINADDFYGYKAFKMVNEYLKNASSENGKYDFCMAGFVLGNTLSDNGTVTRGVCKVENDELIDIVETSNIEKTSIGARATNKEGDWFDIDINSKVSMNCWGFTPEIFNELEERFRTFFQTSKENLSKAEYLVPSVVDELIKEGKCSVKVLNTEDKWFGVTYKEDKETVVNAIKKMIEDGKYPNKLF